MSETIPQQRAFDVLIATAAARGSRTGNRVTALRWAAFLRAAGLRVRVISAYRGESAPLMIALHARRTFALQRAYRQQTGGRLIVALTGTDSYGGWPAAAELPWALAEVDGLIALQADMQTRLPEALRARCTVIAQSSALGPGRRAPHPLPRLLVSGHLRAEKNPFLPVQGLHVHLPELPLSLQHCGGELQAGYADEARAWMRREPRYRYLGELPRRQAHALLQAADALVNPSAIEGAPAVVIEAIGAGVPVLASDIAAHRALLGEDYSGLFPLTGVPAENALALADLVRRFVQDPALRAELTRQLAQRAPLFSPQRECERLLHTLRPWLPPTTGVLR
jgi:glycosyltransferase involved in cell wall biosynthesis